MCAAIFVSPDVAFVGLYAIVPELQKKGLGIRCKIITEMLKAVKNNFSSLN